MRNHSGVHAPFFALLQQSRCSMTGPAYSRQSYAKPQRHVVHCDAIMHVTLLSQSQHHPYPHKALVVLPALAKRVTVSPVGCQTAASKAVNLLQICRMVAGQHSTTSNRVVIQAHVSTL
jgi:hypothetical protein